MIEPRIVRMSLLTVRWLFNIEPPSMHSEIQLSFVSSSSWIFTFMFELKHEFIESVCKYIYVLCAEIYIYFF